MKITAIFAALAMRAAAIGVTGTAEGFAQGVTGGGSAPPVYPNDIHDLVSYLGDDSPRVIVLTKTFDFRGSEGPGEGSGCLPWGNGPRCQIAINQNDWCTNYQPEAPVVNVNYDKAGSLAITVKSNKSIVGRGSDGVIKGKGLRIVSGANNVIIQNIAITDINPQYVWGGDAITVNDSDMVWIDHVTTARIGRQHIVLGTKASKRVTISNNFIDGTSDWSATCDGHHYWGIYLTGSSDLITMKGNYIYRTSGRAPKVKGNTLLHAVNNYWYDNTGHAFEISDGGYVLAEGNVFQNIVNTAEFSGGQLFSSPDANTNGVCSNFIGRACQLNGYGSSGAMSRADTNFLVNFGGKNIASASPYTSVVASVNAHAGYGKL
ncbi:unnamed protein product [Penicillium nalgiovense]|nr:unnamed protein product [Penicillium nalgiovense]CAG8025432.1 unnamed protein product [Penicillium nalgiovense]CAG8031635.1 unnamed protein product [Penicillium nalgiovense]CAG8032854.1 unnamed protein product [Penicillium nalgiovense]CAG8034851.1 unnamed protein product [Penicillium nalgiovense]